MHRDRFASQSNRISKLVQQSSSTEELLLKFLLAQVPSEQGLILQQNGIFWKGFGIGSLLCILIFSFTVGDLRKDKSLPSSSRNSGAVSPSTPNPALSQNITVSPHINVGQQFVPEPQGKRSNRSGS